ncbi:MAG: Endonuclease/exonuclease/phosphatase [Solirubrobacterales bacterium]|nr:Endonuclease/exonuclease/phosphatase [Solirubrobacterales bacterium]
MLVLTWNLFHGRAVPPAGRDLLGDFARALAGWEWDVALLQEVPPWWPPELARAAGAQHRTALTSRNAGLWLRRSLARRRPDVMKSNGGGANAILVRGPAIAEHRRHRLRWWPERRVVHAVRLAGGTWVGNVHAQVHSEQRAQADVGVSCALLRAWSRGAPFVLGGDLNVRAPIAPGMVHAGGHGVDHILCSGLEPVRREVADRGALSDHAPVIAELAGRIEAHDASVGA